LKVSIGGQNVFDVYPAKTNPAIRRFGINTNVYPWNSPYGYDGGYYYGRVKVTF
jgi:iron complex outermembrane receptor protein